MFHRFVPITKVGLMFSKLVFIICILLVVGFFSTKLGARIIDYFSFFVEGQKYNFSVGELRLLWQVGNQAQLKHKTRLFWSVFAIQDAISVLTQNISVTADLKERERLNALLSKLYDFRTKIELETVQKKRGLETTDQIKIGQICVLVFTNFGQFYATVIENNKNKILLRCVGELPKAFNFQYKGDLSVYLWRKGDAGYIFKTQVVKIQQTNAGTVFTVTPSNDIIRTQKRRSVRAKANFNALLYPQHPDTPANTIPEVINGVKCVVRDISEDGALILAKGKCVKGMRAKLQFELGGTEIVMFVKVIRFLYSEPQNLSKIHVHCEKITMEARNAILSYVYEIVPAVRETENASSTC